MCQESCESEHPWCLIIDDEGNVAVFGDEDAPDSAGGIACFFLEEDAHAFVEYVNRLVVQEGCRGWASVKAVSRNEFARMGYDAYAEGARRVMFMFFKRNEDFLWADLGGLLAAKES